MEERKIINSNNYVSDGNVMQEGTIAEITITTADGRKYETNLKLTANDLQLFDDVRQIMK